MAAAPTSPSPPQQERAVRTRERILDATVEILIDEGYAATTTTQVQERAGVSRGALVHHFPAKQDLLVQAIGHLAVARGRWLQREAAALPEPADRVAAGITLLWSAMSGPLFAAATELWVAARTDDGLRAALVTHERQLGRGARQVVATVMGVADPDDGPFRPALDVVLQLFRGAALTALLRDDARWEREVVATATTLFRDRMAADLPLPRPTT